MSSSASVLIYASDAPHIADVMKQTDARTVARLPLGRDLSPPTNPAAVLVVPSTYDLGDTESLLWLWGQHRTTRQAIIPELTADNVRLMHRLGPPPGMDVIWSTEIPSELPRWLDRGTGTDPLEQVRRILESRVQGVPLLERTCTAIFQRRPPPASVVSLAEDLHVEPGTLHYYWRVTVGEPGLKRVLEWRVLLYALEVRVDGTNLLRIARSIGVHPRTLERTSHRLLGHSPRDLTPRDDHVRTVLAAWVSEGAIPAQHEAGPQCLWALHPSCGPAASIGEMA